MRKEIFIAIFIGIFIGVLVAFGAWRANSALKPSIVNKTLELKSSNEVKPTGTKEDNTVLSLVNLDDYEVISESPYKITGVTNAGSIVTISGENEDYIIKAQNDGSFEQEIKLNPGVNQLLFNVLDENKNSYLKKVIVVYSEEFAKSI